MHAFCNPVEKHLSFKTENKTIFYQIKFLKVMKTMKHLFFSAAVLLLFATTGCIDDFTIHGNGIVASEGRITYQFDEVKSEGAFDVHITNGDEFEVVVRAESNLLPYIETDVNNNNMLRIYFRGLHNVKNQLPMEVFVTTPYLNGVKQSGSGIITTDYFENNNFDVAISGSGVIETAVNTITLDAVISGSGNLIISGVAKQADLVVSGSGRLDAYDLTLRDCEALISGSGNMWVNVERFLNASISGSGSIYYSGEPNVETHISGSGRIIENN